jgi:hypothetical protein
MNLLIDQKKREIIEIVEKNQNEDFLDLILAVVKRESRIEEPEEKYEQYISGEELKNNVYKFINSLEWQK